LAKVNIFDSFSTVTSYKLILISYIMLSLSIVYAIIVATSSALDSEHLPTWSTGKKMPIPRTEPLIAAMDGKIYVIGGADYSTNPPRQIDKVEIYDTKKNEWITSPKPMPVVIDHGAALEYNGKIYLPGGNIKGKVPTNKLFIYDPIKDEWQQGKPLPSPRAAFGAQFVNGTLYVVGGVNSSQFLVNTVEAYDPETNTWTEKTPMPSARHHLELAAIDGKLFALGGRILGDGVAAKDMYESATNFNRNEMYDPQTDTWTVKQPMLKKRSGFASTSANGQIYVIGGQELRGTMDSVERYNPLTDKWTFEPSMPSARVGLEAVTVGNKIYALGGQIFTPGGLVALDKNEILSLSNVEDKNNGN
jgi:N-acetylneuraminic acid mutarotase